MPDAQPDYLNAVAVGRTTLGAARAARACCSASRRREAARGRGRRSARTLDLDLILYGDRQIDDDRLTVPHPRYLDRPFVLGPLARLAPRWRDPVERPDAGQPRQIGQRQITR